MFKTICALIGKKRKRQMLTRLPAMLLASLLEMAGLALIASVCAALVSGAWAKENSPIMVLYNYFGFQSKGEFITAILSVMIAVYVFKLFYLSWENYMAAKFVRIVRGEMATALCRRIIRSPYDFYIKHSTAQMQNLLGQDTLQFSVGLDAYMQLFMELPVALGMVACLFWIDPMMTAFATGGLVVLMIVIRIVLKRPIKSASRRQRKSGRSRWKWLHYIAGGVKDIKVGGHEDLFEKKFAEAEADFDRSDYLSRFWNKMPTLFIESVMVLSVLFYILYLNLSDRNMLLYLPGLSALAWTAVRLLPACSRINNSLTQISYSRASVEAVAAVFKETAEAELVIDEKAASVSDGIELRDLTFTYEGKNEAVLKDVSMKIPAGSAVGLVGLSGAGKTTLLDIMLGLLHPQHGEVLIGGVPIDECRRNFWRQTAYVPQNTFLLNDTVRSNVAMGVPSEEIDDERVWGALKKAALAEAVGHLPGGLDTQVGERGLRLSGGERQRLGIARALYRDCPVLVFDEPTSALDAQTEAEVVKVIGNLKGERTLILVSHSEAAVSVCDRIYRLSSGRAQLQ